ncbi:MAG: organic hydroperoxide resistance protein [Actinobacteria bacterium]|nr:organic hydroperoxide resistance protein [Actinomycetota bacterium]
MGKSLYKAVATATHGGRDGGSSRTSDGRLDVALSIPPELGGNADDGTNPEQLFAAGYAACFTSALNRVGQLAGKSTEGSSTTAEVDLVRGQGRSRFALEVTLRVKLPELEPGEAMELVEQAHEVCPYSNATRGNVPVELVVES